MFETIEAAVENRCKGKDVQHKCAKEFEQDRLFGGGGGATALYYGISGTHIFWTMQQFKSPQSAF